jgi:hypothetical protein
VEGKPRWGAGLLVSLGCEELPRIGSNVTIPAILVLDLKMDFDLHLTVEARAPTSPS